MVIVVIDFQVLQAGCGTENYRSDDAAGRRNRQLAVNPRRSRSANLMVESYQERTAHCWAFLKFSQRTRHQFDLAAHFGAGRSGVDGIVDNQTTTGLLIFSSGLPGKKCQNAICERRKYGLSEY